MAGSSARVGQRCAAWALLTPSPHRPLVQIMSGDDIDAKQNEYTKIMEDDASATKSIAKIEADLVKRKVRAWVLQRRGW